MTWAQKSAANLLPLSVERAQLAVALQEWLYTGDMYDLGTPIETCELCKHPDIRYQFKIINRHNGNEILVGSECINKFRISAIDELGNILGCDESRRRVNRDRRFLVNEARKRHLVNTLVALSAVEENFDINSFISYVLDRDAFTPNQLALLFWRLDQHEIEYSPRDFKLTIRRDREKNQLRQMEDWKLQKLWPSMSTSQHTWVRKHTNFEP
ncbi:hypothetical protein [Chromobacterium sp. IIBBL 290-4]|uniref:hypothetical protein n=1 Tax=Chromobacterium sp. IIBBL 290-4 TaxID=2953890 RepID=UPI0020B8FD5F|nr:hypothetical protein [Chromobacterium sp. IIBBL 290-4]UTH73228.1 hypothetical protein NKT35_17065 [Chromobacterium sp. IIBBL 290-4]